MRRVVSRVRNVAILLGFSLALGGCIVTPVGGGYYDDGWVSQAPPAPLFESYGVAPYPGAVWIGGYWGWGPRGYAWNRGHWARGRPGYRWSQPRWSRGSRGWHMDRGGWVRRGRRR